MIVRAHFGHSSQQIEAVEYVGRVPRVPLLGHGIPTTSTQPRTPNPLERRAGATIT